MLPQRLIADLSEFRYRGVKPVVDRADEAEQDMDGYQLSGPMRDRIARRLKAVTFPNRTAWRRVCKD